MADARGVRPGELVLFEPVRPEVLGFVKSAVSLPVSVRRPLCEGLAGCGMVMRISLLDIDSPSRSYAGVDFNSVPLTYDAVRFLTDAAVPVVDSVPPAGIEWYEPPVYGVAECCSAMPSPPESPAPEPEPEPPRKSWLSRLSSRISEMMVFGDSDDDLCDDDEGPCAREVGICPDILPEPEAAVPESDADLEAERREWVDRLTALVLDYVTRFHSMPPRELIMESLRGKLSLEKPHQLSDIVVNGDLRIILPQYNELELKMTPLARTVYIFFLCHPEGVRLADIPDHADELASIYSIVKPGADEKIAESCIADLTDPFGDSLQQKLSLTRRAVRRYILNPELAEYYLIKGERGGLYGIGVPAESRKLPAILSRN